jgi:hypothetical protein
MIATAGMQLDCVLDGTDMVKRLGTPGLVLLAASLDEAVTHSSIPTLHPIHLLPLQYRMNTSIDIC